MNEQEKKYKKIVNNFIKESYQELKDYEVEIKEVKNKRYFASAEYEKPGLFSIKVSQKVRNWDQIELKSMFAHELSHFVVYSKIGYLLTKTSDFLEEKFFFWKRIQEKKADKITIEKGYGEYMIASRKKNNSSKSNPCCAKQKKSAYMSLEEIKEYIKKNKDIQEN